VSRWDGEWFQGENLGFLFVKARGWELDDPFSTPKASDTVFDFVAV